MKRTLSFRKIFVNVQTLCGFTLIEILIVLAIVGILTGIAATSYQATRKSARDSQRKADLVIISAALEKFKSDYGYYPHDPGGFGTDRSDTPFWNKGCNFSECHPSQPPLLDCPDENICCHDHLLCVLTEEGYLDTLPVDPGLNMLDENAEDTPGACGKYEIYIYEPKGDNGSSYRLSAKEETKGYSGCDIGCEVDWLSGFHFCLKSP